MRSVLVHKAALALVVMALATACGSEEVDAPIDDQSSDELGSRCASGDLLFQVKGDDSSVTTQKGSPALFDSSRDIGTSKFRPLRVGTLVRRLQVGREGGEIYSQVDVLSKASEGSRGWILTDALEPVPGGCEVVEENNASMAERIAFRGDSLPARLGEGSLQCALGLSEGFVGGAAGLVAGIASVLQVAPELIAGVAVRDRDIVLMALGNQTARARIAERQAGDSARIDAALAIVGHAIPALHALALQQYGYYQLLDAPTQSRFLCNVIGRTAFEVITAVSVSSKTSSVTESEALFAKVETSMAEAAAKAPLPGRVGTSPEWNVTKAVEYVRSDKWVSAQPSFVQADSLVRSVAKIHEQLLQAKSLSRRKELIAALNDTTNPADKLGWIPRGNCSYQATSALLTLVSGAAVCSMGEAPKGEYLVSTLKGMRNAGVVVPDSVPAYTTAGRVAEQAAALKEGQMALLGSHSSDGNHLTLLVKLNGEIMHINNQNFNKTASGADIIALSEWFTQWQARTSGGQQYRLVMTDQVIPFR